MSFDDLMDVPPFEVDDEDSMEKEAMVHDAEASYDVTLAEEASREYVGQWNRLISTTNWEKGRLISQWRQSMADSGVPIQLYSDEAWSRRVGNVSSQHVGRLRRVYDRFGDDYDHYPGLYWSHFQAALDWNDAEVWLEGAVQQRWSVSQMRNQRWVAIGAPPEFKPRDEDVILAELDEDVTSIFDSSKLSGTTGEAVLPSGTEKVTADGVVSGTGRDSHSLEEDFAEKIPEGKTERGQNTEIADLQKNEDEGTFSNRSEAENAMTEKVLPKRLFEDLPPLPADLEEAMEMFKLAILNHKLDHWTQISKEDVQAVLEMLKQLCES